MRILAALGFGALLYGVSTFGANVADAGGISGDEVTALKEMRTGDMAKLVVHDTPRDMVEGSFADAEGREVGLADYRGKVVVLNFWATWCPPCRAEMPSIDRLAGEIAGDDVAVLAVSTDRFGIDRVQAFLDEIGVEHLPTLHDKGGRFARGAAVIGLPVTLILDREGREIARLQGEAEWDGDAAKALIARIVEITAPES